MESELLKPLLDWITQNPVWAGVVVFLLSLAESLAVVGVLVPGVALMFGVGALIGLGHLGFWEMATWAVAGAVAGDGISFWLGRRYREQLRGIWPFSRHPAMLEQGERFFSRWGGKSIIFGRFVGPVRAVIPLVAGMMDMPPTRFLFANIASALAWAPAYLIPGMLFGASLELAAEVAGRLVVVLLIVLVLLWFAAWLAHRLFNLMQPRARNLLAGFLTWAERHPLAGQLAASLGDPNHPEARGMAALATVLLLSVLLFGASVAMTQGGATSWDQTVYAFFQSLHTPTFNNLMVSFTQLGDGATVIPLVLVVLAYLWLRGRRFAAGHWVAAVGFGILASLVLKLGFGSQRPPVGELVMHSYSFPSGHSLNAVTVYGFLAVLLARELSPARRWIPYGMATVLIAGIALSRLYLGVHWLSDILGGIGLGLVWVSLLGIAYGSRHTQAVGFRGLFLTSLATLLLIGGIYIARDHSSSMERYLPPPSSATMNHEQWLSTDWRQLPEWRDDLRSTHNHPFTLQWAGKLDAITATLERHGWKPAKPFTAGSVLSLLNPNQALEHMPILPQVHDGRHESLLMSKQVRGFGRIVVRLWNAGIALQPGDTPLWIGNVSDQFVRRPARMLAYPKTAPDFNGPLTVLAPDLRGWSVTEKRRQGTNAPGWDGRLLLIQP
ncbi:MAG: phosphatase PAP2 family protein [Chromatiales bacterium]|nr:phosphatase PAP2 family protein [Chromatiales bacterium]